MFEYHENLTAARAAGDLLQAIFIFWFFSFSFSRFTTLFLMIKPHRIDATKKK
jgi:hypothetical protein